MGCGIWQAAEYRECGPRCQEVRDAVPAAGPARPGLTDPAAVLPLLFHPDAARLRRWPVSPAVNRSGTSDPAFVQPLNPA